MRNIKLAIFNIKKNFKNAKELKSTFIISIIGMCLNNVAFIILWYYFGKTVGNINPKEYTTVQTDALPVFILKVNIHCDKISSTPYITP